MKTAQNIGTRELRALAGLEMEKKLGIRNKKALLARARTKKRTVGSKQRLHVTASLRERVTLLAGTGMTRPDIADVLDIGRSTLEENFSRELQHGVKIFRAQLMEISLKAAKSGKGEAIRTLVALNLATIREQQFLGAPANGSGPMIEGQANHHPQITAAKVVTGKKEQAQIDAIAASVDHESGWGSDLDVNKSAN